MNIFKNCPKWILSDSYINFFEYINFWDENDLDAHCVQPNGVEIYYSQKKYCSTTGELDVDITRPGKGKPAADGIFHKSEL